MRRLRDHVPRPVVELLRTGRSVRYGVGGSVRRHRSRVFRRIQRTNAWGSPESVSGAGSAPDQTVTLRRELPRLFERFGVRTLVDAPCGDLNWMQDVGARLDRYVGCDIVPDLVAALAIAPPWPHAEFRVLDVVREPPPAADAILCRDCLVHLSFKQALAAVRNFRSSGSSLLIATTFPSLGSNHDIPTGRWRPLNLQLAPFDFPPPLDLLNEGCTEGGGGYADKSLGVWRLADLG